MTKNSKKQTKRAEDAKVATAQLRALEHRDANSLVIGIDLGDRTSFYCVRTLESGADRNRDGSDYGAWPDGIFSEPEAAAGSDRDGYAFAMGGAVAGSARP